METVVRIYVLAFVLFLVGCKKDALTTWPAETFKAPRAVRINALHTMPDGTLRAAGGERGRAGWLFTTRNAGQDWQALRISDRSSIYCIHFVNDSLGWMGGDTLQLWRTTDGENWSYYWLGDQVPTHVSDRPAVRQISHRGDTQLCFAAGDLYYRGAAFMSTDAGQHWTFKVADNAVYQASFFEETARTFGYGTALEFSNGAWQTMRAPADHLVSVLPTGAQTAIAASSLGNLYRLQTEEKSSEKIDLPTKEKILWMSGAQWGERLVFGGSNGELAVSEDGGNSWQIGQLEERNIVLSLAVDATSIWIGSESGHIFRLNWPL